MPAATQTQEAPPQADVERIMQQADAVRQRLELFGQQQTVLEDVIADKTRGKESLEALVEAGDDDVVLLPVGGDAFVRAKVVDRESVLKGVGAGYVTEQSRTDAAAALDEDIKALNEDLGRVSQALSQARNEYEQLQSLLQRYAGGAAPQA